MLMKHERTKLVAASEAEAPAGIGHNNPPREPEKKAAGAASEPFGLRAAWLRFAHERELRRLAKLHVRIAMKERALAEIRKERTMIMNRCIRRMRRASGRN